MLLEMRMCCWDGGGAKFSLRICVIYRGRPPDLGEGPDPRTPWPATRLRLIITFFSRGRKINNYLSVKNWWNSCH